MEKLEYKASGYVGSIGDAKVDYLLERMDIELVLPMEYQFGYGVRVRAISENGKELDAVVLNGHAKIFGIAEHMDVDVGGEITHIDFMLRRLFKSPIKKKFYIEDSIKYRPYEVIWDVDSNRTVIKGNYKNMLGHTVVRAGKKQGFLPIRGYVENHGDLIVSGLYSCYWIQDEDGFTTVIKVKTGFLNRFKYISFEGAKMYKVVTGVCSALFVLGIGFSCFSVIETGERGVVLRFGEYKYTMDEGLNFKVPLIDTVHKLQVRDRNYNSDVEVSSKDLQTIKISSSLVYSLDTRKVGDIYRRYGNDIETTIIKPTVAEVINSTIAQYPIEEFVSKRDEISQKIMDTLKVRMADIGIDIKSFLITNHDFSDEYNKSIENKKIAEQAVYGIIAM